MKSEREVETKLEVADSLVLPELATVASVHGAEVTQKVLDAQYFDTVDLRLARSGTTLRHRSGEGRPRWTLKIGGLSGTGLDREELSAFGPVSAMPAELHDLLAARLRGAVVAEAVCLRTRRTAEVLYDGHGNELVEVADDRVEVLRGATVVQSWREIEVEQREGGAEAAAQVVALLQRAGAVVGDQTPKAIRAMGATVAEMPVVGRKDPAGLLAQRSLALGMERLLHHDLGVRRGLEDAVHQVRVSCRRLRSELRSFGPLLEDERVSGLRDELAWLAGAMGSARDLEVLRVRLRTAAALDPPLDVSPVDALLAAQEQDAKGIALAALQSARYLALLDLLESMSTDIGLAPLASSSCGSVVPGLVAVDWKHLTKRVHRLAADSPDEDWHRARILAKRARYAAEAAPGAEVKAMARASKALQEQLGEHQDAVVTAARVLALGADHPEVGVACGRLAERERRELGRIRLAFLKGRKAALRP